MNIRKTERKHTQRHMLRHKHKTLWAVPNKTLADAAGAGRSAMKLQRVYKLVTKGQHIWWQDMVTCLWLILSRSSIYIPFKCWLISSTKGRLNIRSCWTPWDSPDRLAWSIYFPVSSSVFFSVFFFFSTDRQSAIHSLLQSINTTFDPSGPFSDQGLCGTKERHMHWKDFII